jgi:hypothetical protein
MTQKQTAGRSQLHRLMPQIDAAIAAAQKDCSVTNQLWIKGPYADQIDAYPLPTACTCTNDGRSTPLHVVQYPHVLKPGTTAMVFDSDYTCAGVVRIAYDREAQRSWIVSGAAADGYRQNLEFDESGRLLSRPVPTYVRAVYQKADARPTNAVAFFTV